MKTLRKGPDFHFSDIFPVSLLRNMPWIRTYTFTTKKVFKVKSNIKSNTLLTLEKCLCFPNRNP